MKVEQLIELLSEYNLDAHVNIIVHSKPHNFTLTYGVSDGCTKANCTNVNLFIEKLNINEKQNT